MDYDVEYLRRNFSNVCRFCLAGEDCLPLFIESVVNETLVDAIDVLLPKVDEHDGLPNLVCERCYQTMADFAKFEATAVEARRALESVSALNEEDMQHVNKAVLRLVGQSEEIDPSPNHNSELSEPKHGKKKSCPVCGKLVSQLSKHMPVHGGTKRLACEHCDKRFAHPGSLRKHLNIHRNIRNHRCAHCAQSFCDRSSLRYHLEAKHQSERRLQCDSCDRQFHTASQWKQHTLLAHGERNYSCELCGQTFLLKHHLADHVQAHSDGKPFGCDVCGKTFNRVRYLAVHRRLHEPNVVTSDGAAKPLSKKDCKTFQ